MIAKTGIVFSGGGVRGFAHVGALKALEEANIFPGVISGVSAGAIVGSLYADGYSPAQILELFLAYDLHKLVKFNGFKLGLLNPVGIQNILSTHLRAKTFEELKLPLTIACTNFDLVQTEYFNSGNLLDPLIASMSFPLLFQAKKIGNNQYLDGGLMNNFPVQPLIGTCEIIVGVHVNPIERTSEYKGNYMDRIVHMGLRANIETNINHCGLFIEPPELSKFHLLNLSSAKEIFTIGYEYTRQLLSEQGDLSAFQSV